jgi:hypothetical protein
VTLVLRVYKPKNFANRGLSLDQVIVNETPRYYNAGGVATSELAARGIVFNAPPRAVQAQPGTSSAVGGVEEPVGSGYEDGLSFPAPQPAAAAVQVQAQARPVAAAPQAVAAPVEQQETPEQKLARLERENAELKNAGSAGGAPVVQSPWDSPGDGQRAGITYQG